MARRADGAFKRDVALKLPLLTRQRQDLAPRFVHERDILSSLEHPHIARLYDAGVDAEGLPYLSMEYVKGQPLPIGSGMGDSPISRPTRRSSTCATTRATKRS